MISTTYNFCVYAAFEAFLYVEPWFEALDVGETVFEAEIWGDELNDEDTTELENVEEPWTTLEDGAGFVLAVEPCIELDEVGEDTKVDVECIGEDEEDDEEEPDCWTLDPIESMV